MMKNEDDAYHKIMNWGFLCAQTAHLLGVTIQCPIVKHFSGRRIMNIIFVTLLPKQNICIKERNIKSLLRKNFGKLLYRAIYIVEKMH